MTSAASNGFGNLRIIEHVHNFGWINGHVLSGTPILNVLHNTGNRLIHG